MLRCNCNSNCNISLHNVILPWLGAVYSAWQSVQQAEGCILCVCAHMQFSAHSCSAETGLFSVTPLLRGSGDPDQTGLSQI